MVGKPGMENTYFNFYFLIAYVPKIFCFKNSPCLLVYQLDSFSVGQFLSWLQFLWNRSGLNQISLLAAT